MNPVFVNGKNYDWGNITCILLGVYLVGITKIEYDESRDSENNYGFGNQPVSYGNKNYTYSGSLEIYTDELRRIIPVAPNRKILEIPPFSISVMFSGDGVNFTTDKLSNCRFTKNPFSAKQNDSSILVTVPFTFAGLSQ